jgi:SAM-dependent methyltransferase
MPSIDEVRSMMDKGYADGTAYRTALPFDLMRGERIRMATLDLAGKEALDAKVRVLDVGSGEGGIASFWPHHNIVGVEISQVGVDKAKRTFPTVDFRCSAIEEFKLSEGEEPFRIVVAQESIEHWTNVDHGLKAIRAAMAPEGRLVITTPNRDSLHCRISRKLGLGEPPHCSFDHVHEFSYWELIHKVEAFGFKRAESKGVGLLPYWTMERVFGHEIRRLTDGDYDVNAWMNDIGCHAPAEYAFIQCHRFVLEQ